MSESDGPYRVERVETHRGPSWRLAGPGLENARAYPWEDFRGKLAELAEVMNFAYAQGQIHPFQLPGSTQASPSDQPTK